MLTVMRILLLSAYEAVSHELWRSGLTRHLKDIEWTVLSLPPRHFAWRLRGAPLSWLANPGLDREYDLVMATSTVDLATLRGLHPSLSRTPALYYLHENQFAYPASADQRESLEPRMVQLYAALSAERVVFNSSHNRDTFLSGAEALVRGFPDFQPEGLAKRLAARSEVLPVPLEPECFTARPGAAAAPRPIRLVWNHRWEYDKGPERLLALLECLETSGVEWRLDLLGQVFRCRPEALDTLLERFESRLGERGPIADPAAYRECLARADVVLSTALHDFQGLAVLEAVAAGCRPLVPDRLAYPEFFEPGWRYPSYPDDPGREARAMAERLIAVAGQPPPSVRDLAWPTLAPAYRRAFQRALRARAGSGHG